MNEKSDVIKRLRTYTIFDYINPTVKIISFLFFIAIVFVAQNISQLLIVLGVSVLFLTFIRVNFKYYLKPLIWILIFSPFLIFFNMIVIEGDSEPISSALGGIYTESFIISAQIILKIYLLILVSSVLILSLSETELTNGFEKLISPLKYIKIPTQEIALIISIAIRYIPLFLYETKLILEAQSSRGIDFYSGNTKTKIIALKNSLNPLIVNSFIKAKELSVAMSVRGYKIGMKRTKYEIYKFKYKELLFLSFFVLFLVGTILMNVYDVSFLNNGW
ncbi:MAG: energy-coupling factor transporter transmembrane protein EcfT [Candidatus Hepatoplasma vulgare]|nr:MAG: energy-coupling factor transporter transmembrane protein EcfT [Candidatus Hepatoplasma sp.]